MKARLCVLAALTMLTASCASGGNEERAEPTVAAETTSTISNETSSATETLEDESSMVELGEPDWAKLEKRVLPVMGGLELGIPSDHVIHHHADMALIRAPFENDAGRYLPTMVLAHVMQLPNGEPVDGIDIFTTAALGEVGTATATGETLDLFGLTMERWSFRIEDGQPIGPHYLYSAFPFGDLGPSQWQPFPLGEIFLAETASGVLAIGWVGVDEAELAEAKAIFDAVAPTVNFDTDPFSTPAVPVVPIGVTPPSDPPPPVALPEGWTPFESSSQPLEAGTYSSGNLGTPLQFTVDGDWWIQPNLPSWVVITGNDSFGPGDRGLVFRNGIEWLVPVGHDYQAAGEPIPIPSAAEFVANAPDALEIEQSDITIGGRDAIQLDVAIGDVDSCGPGAVCEYRLDSIYPFPDDSIRVGYSLRIHYIEDDLNEPLWILAVSPDPSWFDQATEVIETIEFG